MKKNETPGSTIYILRKKGGFFFHWTALKQHKKIKHIHICSEREENGTLSPDSFETTNPTKKAHTQKHWDSFSKSNFIQNKWKDFTVQLQK